MTIAEPAFTEVQLIGVPVEKLARWLSHHDTIRRELEILLTSRRPDTDADKMETYLDVLGRRVGDFFEPLMADFRHALSGGHRSLDLKVEADVETATEARELSVLLDEVNEFCRDQDSLITVATPEDLVRFRSWILGEFVRQVDGGTTVSWRDFSRASGPATDGSTRSGGGSMGVGDEVTVVFSGELDLASVAELQMAIQDARRAGAGSMVLEMTGVTFIDSVGLSLLVTARNRLVDEGGRMRLVLPSRLRSLFDLSGLLELLEVEFVE